MSALVLESNQSTIDKVGDAIQQTFSSILSTNLQMIEVHDGPIENPPKNISAIVVLKNPDIQGTLCLGMPTETAFQIFSKFYGAKIEQIDERILDGVGEVTNMVFGLLKKDLNKEGFDFEMFIPTVIVGNEFNFISGLKGAGHTVTLHFESTEGGFWVQLNTKKNSNKKKSKSAV